MLAGFEQAALAYGDGWRVPHNPPDADRRTDLLFKPVTQALTVNNPDAARLKRSFVLFTGKATDDGLTPVFGRIAERLREDANWHYYERPFEHWPILDKPRKVASLLLELG
jgi:hypothetical protein